MNVTFFKKKGHHHAESTVQILQAISSKFYSLFKFTFQSLLVQMDRVLVV